MRLVIHNHLHLLTKSLHLFLGYIHLFCNRPEATYNAFPRPTEFADPVEPLPHISVDDELTALSSVPLPFCSGRLLSDWPVEYCKVVHR